LSDVRFILQACVAAKRVAKQSVNVALGAATVGTLVSAGGVLPMTTRRIIGVVNMATLVAMANGVRTSAALERRPLPAPRDRTPWHALDAHGVLERLGSSSRGLTRGEAQYRYRPDPSEKPALVELGEAITDELFNPLAPLLAAGAGLSAVVGSLADATMVGGVVVLNAVAGGVQRFRTERAIRDLSRTSRRKALVRRGGEIRQVDASLLVRGDVVLLSAGDVIPADCRIIEAESLEVDASSLTGESMPVKKAAVPSFDREVADRTSMLFDGTSVASGRATAVVVATGDATEAHRSGPAPAVDPRASGVEQRLSSIIDLTAPIALTAASGLVAVGLLRGRKLSEVLGAGVSLAVASVPEGLPLIATAAQLAAAKRLSERGALVRNPRSIEALGRVDLLCVDKTGTVTEGRIGLGAVTDGTTEEPASELSGARLRALAAALRATPDPRLSVGSFDPTDAALVRAAEKLAVTPAYATDGWERASELPFEAERGYHAVLGQCGSDSWLSVKGAPEVVLPACSGWLRDGERRPLDDSKAQELSQVASELARRGLRVLAVAERVVGPGDVLDPSRPVGLAFAGFLAFTDPVRPTAAAALERLRTAGVETIMITGDHPSTAEAIANELSLLKGKGQLTGAELARMSEEELDLRVNKIAVFARLTPSQKVRIVRALQRKGHCVAMVGDGANDAPAIRLANVGIAIGEHSTAAARGAADVVLTDERIETLAEAIVEGRAMWASVRDAVSILVGGNLGEIGFTLSAGLVDGRPPLNARQLLLVNLLTDVAPAMAIAVRPPDAETLASLAEEGPDASLAEPLGRDIASRAVVTTAGAGAAWLVARVMGSRERASTVGLLALVGTQLGQTLMSGGFSRPVVVTSALSALALGITVQTPGLSHFFGCRPLGPVGWATAVGASTLATAASVTYPEVVTRIARRLKLAKVIPAQDPAQLAAKG
jgi:cation-transporting ATPase I